MTGWHDNKITGWEGSVIGFSFPHGFSPNGAAVLHRFPRNPPTPAIGPTTQGLTSTPMNGGLISVVLRWTFVFNQEAPLSLLLLLLVVNLLLKAHVLGILHLSLRPGWRSW